VFDSVPDSARHAARKPRPRKSACLPLLTSCWLSRSRSAMRSAQ